MAYSFTEGKTMKPNVQARIQIRARIKGRWRIILTPWEQVTKSLNQTVVMALAAFIDEVKGKK